ncbi:MAG: hypothetical protein ABI835_10255 [Chloroflexota bacterium]
MTIKRLKSARLLLLVVVLLTFGSAVVSYAAPSSDSAAQIVNKTERITFVAGATSATVDDSIGGVLVNHYLLTASAGQFMQVTVTSPGNNVYLSVYSPSGIALARAQTGAQSYSSELFETGDYNFRVSTFPGGAWSTYTLNVSVTGTPLPTPTPPIETTQRINFVPGGTSATINGRIDGFEFDNYLLNARAGQYMQAWVTSPANDAYLTVVSPLGSPLARAQAGAQSFSGTLPENGDYQITVSSPSGTAHSNYTLYVAVTGGSTGGTSPVRINFAAGAVSATVSGQVNGTTTRSYLLNARAGQRMQIVLYWTGSPVYVTLVSPLGSPLARAEAGAQGFDGTLPENGDYRITVSAPAGTPLTNFTMTVTVTGAPSGGTSPVRINFAAGATSATVNGQVDGGTARNYVLGARAGQRMIVSVATASNPVYLTVVSPGGTTLVSAIFGETTLDRFLPETGDYAVQVSTLPGTPLTNFTLSVSITG